MTPDQLTALAQRLQSMSTAYTSISPQDRQARDDLLAAAEYLRQCAEMNPTDDWKRYAKEGETAQACIERHRDEQDALLTLLAEARRNQRPQYQETPGPTIDINIKIAVPANWSDRLDMQWIVEREIHADRWSWNYAAPQPPSAQADAVEALRLALDALSCTGESDDPGHRCGHCDDYVDRNAVVGRAFAPSSRRREATVSDIRLTERQRRIVSFALLRFADQAYAQAEYCAQKGPVEHVSKFQDDAKDADEIRLMLAAQGGGNA